MQRLTPVDLLLTEIEHSLRTSHVNPGRGERSYPAEQIPKSNLEPGQQKHIAGLMRVNNAGEVAAQGLYRGQAITAKDPNIRLAMLEASDEENEHLNWCQTRLSELNSNRSVLDGIWYLGSFLIGATAGLAGDKWSLGFVKETEQQVSSHLESHLAQLPENDQRSQAILQQMKLDEMKHAINAEKAGAADLPEVIKKTMDMVSKVMTFTAYRI
jgi:ubiquinone biosynthesis monooxygenase Coq7